MATKLTDEDIENIVYKFRSYSMSNGISPYEHLYEWLGQANPEVFKQWQAVYDIERKN